MCSAPTAKSQTIDDFLARLDDDKRAALEKLRQAIRAVIPEAEECINYGVPAFRLEGKMLVAFGAGARHCAFYPGAFPIATHQAALKDYDTSKGTIRFTADRPLPVTLVRKLVKARLAQRTAGNVAPARKSRAK